MGTIYYLFHLRNPSPIPYLTNSGFTRASDVRATIEGIEHHHVRFVMMNLYIDDVAHDLNVDYLYVLRSYMAEKYRLVRTYDSGLQLWERSSLP